MVRSARTAILLLVLSLLVSAATAHAECAWVFWQEAAGPPTYESSPRERSSTVISIKSETGTSYAPEVPIRIGGPSRTRTVDPLIKSQLLYQLS